MATWGTHPFENDDAAALVLGDCAGPPGRALRGPRLAEDFQELLEAYVERTYGPGEAVGG